MMKTLKITSTLLLIAALWVIPAQAKSIDTLKAASGDYHVVVDDADSFSFCRQIEAFRLSVNGATVTITVKQSADPQPEVDTYPEVNTGKHFDHSYVNGV